MNYSGSTAADGVSQEAAPKKQDRSRIIITNLGDRTLFFSFGTAAAIDQGFALQAQSPPFVLTRNQSNDITKALNVISAIAGVPYSVVDDSTDF